MLEGLVRLGGVFLLIGLGMGVEGAVLASGLAVIVAYFAALPSPSIFSFKLRGIAIPFLEGLQAIQALVAGPAEHVARQLARYLDAGARHLVCRIAATRFASSG